MSWCDALLHVFKLFVIIIIVRHHYRLVVLEMFLFVPAAHFRLIGPSSQFLPGSTQVLALISSIVLGCSEFSLSVDVHQLLLIERVLAFNRSFVLEVAGLTS